MYGELIPVGGGDPIPLLKKKLLIGRREKSCDIVLRFPNVSAHHCEMELRDGYWYVTDQNSRNGIKVNNVRVDQKRLDPGDRLRVAKHGYQIKYDPTALGAVGPPPVEESQSSSILHKSLLERAGLERKKDSRKSRYDVLNNEAGQIKDPNKPV